jgi:hypothetical protein
LLLLLLMLLLLPVIDRVCVTYPVMVKKAKEPV